MFLNYVVALVSVLLYLHGFFPIPARPLQEVPPNNVSGTYKRAVIVVIDALRLDFISETQTPFLDSAYKNTGCFIHLKVETPTVTLPRIKALTTGNVPQFIDIILNFASPTKIEDSIIHRAHAKGKKIVFYGDDVWLKLFPDEFLRSEGTSSFFVNDYTQVDDNVTRNVNIEKKRKDWDIMILHYLGLDHIGHVYGPKSPLISTKLKEMDSIIEELDKSLKNTIFIITGDHGMRDSGGHGGSTYPETHVPLIVLNMPCHNDTFAQIDIPANLAVLLGIDIPATSIGRLQPSLLHHLQMFTYLDALKYNTILLRNKLDLCQNDIELAFYLHDLYLVEKNDSLANGAKEIYENCAKTISDTLQKTSVRQNLGSLVIAGVISMTVLLKILQEICDIEQRSELEPVAMLVILLLQFINVDMISSFVLVIISLLFFIRNFVSFDVKKPKFSFLIVCAIIHPLTFLSSSFLEEEHQFWYFFTNTFILIQILKSRIKFKWLLVFASIRFIRVINQVGDKWASLPDLADWLIKIENHVYLQIIFITSLVLIFYYNYSKNSIISIVDVLILILIYVFRFVLKEEVTLGKTLWSLIFIRFLLSLSVLPTWVFIITLLLKPQNTILIPFCLLTSRFFHTNLTGSNLYMAHWWLGNLAFFAQGHDNSLASVDISSGYIGLSQYEPLFVFPQVLCHTYALPVLSHLSLFSKKIIDPFPTLAIFVLFRLYIVLVVFVVMFVHRHHLFIWSVFAPKMFVEASHFGFLFIEVCFYYIGRFVNKILY